MALWGQRGPATPQPPNTASLALALGIPSLPPSWLSSTASEPPPCASLVHPLCIWTYNVNAPLPPPTRIPPETPPRTNGTGPVPNQQKTGQLAARQTHPRVEWSVQHECQR